MIASGYSEDHEYATMELQLSNKVDHYGVHGICNHVMEDELRSLFHNLPFLNYFCLLCFYLNI